jgi:O-antigen ligase
VISEAKIARASRYLVFFILAVLPLERIPSLDVFSITVRLSQVAAIILIAINLPTLWRSAKAMYNRLPWGWLVAFWGACLMSTALAAHQHRALMVTAFTIFVGLLAWVIALRFERDQLATYLKIIVISALASVAFGLYQFFADLLGVPYQWTGLRAQYTKDVFGFPRIQSTGLEPLYYANYLLIPAAILTAAIAYGYRRRAALWAVVPVATVVWLTVSRGAIVALIFILLAGGALTLWRRQYRTAGLLAMAVVASAILAYGLLYLGTNYVAQKKTEQTKEALENFKHQTTNVNNGESSTGRALTRSLALQAWHEHPVFGIGPGGFGAYASAARPDKFSGTDGIVNNEPLEVLAETGLIGLVTLLGFFVSVAWIAWRAVKRTPLDQVAIVGPALALVATAAQYMTFSTLYITHVWVTAGLLIGAALTAERRSRKKAA